MAVKVNSRWKSHFFRNNEVTVQCFKTVTVSDMLVKNK